MSWGGAYYIRACANSIGMMDEDAYFERVRLHLPPYLTAADKNELIAQIRDHVSNRQETANYFAVIPAATDPLQGDGWRGFTLIDFDSGQRQRVIGLVLSNTCDVQLSNRPGPDERIVFAPLLDLARYKQFLREAGEPEDRVDQLMVSVRRQEVNRIFYLPAVRGLVGESIVALDAIYSEPIRALDYDATNRCFSLSMFGWYMLLLKLSIHFTRMQETLNRNTAGPTAGATSAT